MLRRYFFDHALSSCYQGPALPYLLEVDLSNCDNLDDEAVSYLTEVRSAWYSVHSKGLLALTSLLT